jgi:hypothetical protein
MISVSETVGSNKLLGRLWGASIAFACIGMAGFFVYNYSSTPTISRTAFVVWLTGALICTGCCLRLLFSKHLPSQILSLIVVVMQFLLPPLILLLIEFASMDFD